MSSFMKECNDCSVSNDICGFVVICGSYCRSGP